MKITFGQQTTKVKQLADLISQEISMGTYKSDSALPSINQLSRNYHVSRDTVFKAFIDLKDRGMIDSTPGKGYYVTNKLKNILLLLDEYSQFKYSLYNSFIKKLSINYKVDLLFHQYNERLFNTIIRESSGRYNKYIVMNFDNEKFSSNLYKIEPSKLLLLDFGKFDKKEYSYVCQDFDDGFYIVIRQIDVVHIIKKSRAEGLKCGSDFGVLAYNDTPSYEVIDQGITSISIDWEQMGKLAADFVLSGKEIKEYLPTEVHIRHSL